MIYVCKGCLASQGKLPAHPWEKAICGLCNNYDDAVQVEDRIVATFDMNKVEKRIKRLAELRAAAVQQKGIYIP